VEVTTGDDQGAVGLAGAEEPRDDG
jgi:hypothetical protein